MDYRNRKYYTSTYLPCPERLHVLFPTLKRSSVYTKYGYYKEQYNKDNLGFYPQEVFSCSKEEADSFEEYLKSTTRKYIELTKEFLKQ